MDFRKVNRDLNHCCLVYLFSLRFSGSKFLVNSRRQFRVRKKLSYTVYSKPYKHFYF